MTPADEITAAAQLNRLAEQRSLALDYLESLTANTITETDRQRLLRILDDGRLTRPACGKTQGIDGTTYPPCARPAGHREAYCRDVDRVRHFIARAVLGAPDRQP